MEEIIEFIDTERHIVVVQIDEEFYSITPENGYRLYNISLNRYFSEAVVKADKINNFIGVI